MGCIDLDAELDDLEVPVRSSQPSYGRAEPVVMLHRQPLGRVELEVRGGRLLAEETARRVADELGPSIAEHLRAERVTGLRRTTGPGSSGSAGGPACWPTPPDEELPSISVVLCTRDRPEQAASAVTRLLELDYPDYEVVVVDNAPSGDATRRAMDRLADRDRRVRYVREDVPGLANARNRGVTAATGEIVAFTDDDIRVGDWWLHALARGFGRAPDVVCVTGAVVPASIESRADRWFGQAVNTDEKWGWAPERFHRDDRDRSPLFPYQVGCYGGGGNAAFRRDHLLADGGFDPALGAGTATGGGEDLDAFLRVVAEGHLLAYEPAAVVWHHHGTDDSEVRRQAFRYGVGLGAFLFKIACSPTHAPRLAVRAPRALRYLLSSSSPKNDQKRSDFPRSLSMLELAGIAWGPVAYVRSRRADARRRRG